MTSKIVGKKITVRGIVQGVGFRPFIYTQAIKFNLAGWIRNNSSGVEIDVRGDPENIESFLSNIKTNPPALARIDEIRVEESNDNGYTQFTIINSLAEPGKFLPISPDISICSDCIKELFNPDDRRFRYPFINCTNCGPRFTIIRDIPYDRPNTTMGDFNMCPKCRKEYENPFDRRFHAQPIACPDCGPQVSFEAQGEILAHEDIAIQTARKWLANGKILAVKGLGGFQLICDASHHDAVMKLRLRKRRSEKSFAVMVFNLTIAKKNAMIDAEEEIILNSKEKPILLVKRKQSSTIVKEVAPGLRTLGIMLPYTPLHYLLLEPADGFPEALVMTSGNLSEEPIVHTNKQAIEKLSGLADGFLLNNREIHTRIDDSVVTVTKKQIYPIRRARGFAPNPFYFAKKMPNILSTGAQLKNTFCLTREEYAFISHHIGDLDNLETLTSFEKSIDYYEHLFRIKPQYIACDLHPDYLSTQYAIDRSLNEKIPLYKIQHHHAHLAACLADNNRQASGAVIGVCFDGTGYGTDGAIWGGEFLYGNCQDYQRKYHLAYSPLPGGDQANHHLDRLSLAYLWNAGISWSHDLSPVQNITLKEIELLSAQLTQKINTPLTSSMGRLFDGVSSLIGLRQIANYEAQAAMELEAIADPAEYQHYQFNLNNEIIDPAPLWLEVIKDLRCKVKPAIISARFHNSVVEIVIRTCKRIHLETCCKTVVLSGGVWQNRLLLQRTIKGLEQSGFEVLTHSRVPTNDGGVSLGQAMIVAKSIDS